MNPAARFAIALGQALAAMALYNAGHPARANARARLRDALMVALTERGGVRLSFMDHDVISWAAALPELRGWDWTPKFMRAGIGRVEVDAQPVPTNGDLDLLLEALHARLVAPAGEDFAAFAERGVRVGPLGIIEPVPEDNDVVDLVDALAASTLSPETDCVRWIHDQVAQRDLVPMAEVEAVVHGLAVAMRHDQQIMLPLLQLKTQDQYTTTHSCNVAMLAMGLAEEVGLSGTDVRAIGTAALLHDIGYPNFRYDRACHYASRLVHVCDLNDALSTDRPYRKAWPRQRTLDMLRAQSGIEVDGELVEAFIRLVERAGEHRLLVTDTPQNDWNAALGRTAAGYATEGVMTPA